LKNTTIGDLNEKLSKELSLVPYKTAAPDLGVWSRNLGLHREEKQIAHCPNQMTNNDHEVHDGTQGAKSHL